MLKQYWPGGTFDPGSAGYGQGLGYQGDQCDTILSPTNKSSYAHSTVANIPDLDRFVDAVLAYTGAKRVDIVGHSLGVTLARAWMKGEHKGHLVRRLVAIVGPNHGIIDCSPSPSNYFQQAAFGGFTPDSAIWEAVKAHATLSVHQSGAVLAQIVWDGHPLTAAGHTSNEALRGLVPQIAALPTPFYPPGPNGEIYAR